MATVTPNFNWPVPTSTDLVKDGATAIEALGDSIDGSLVDLKGGTTGQVLSKTSNTDMDFTWVTSDDANAIQNSIVNAKGDLIGASANDTPAILSVGSNGETLVADSSTSTGLRYNPHIEAGKNFLINGGFDIWQRGTSFTTTDVYSADRWKTLASAAGTFAQETTTIPSGARYAMKITAGATTDYALAQVIETSNAVMLAGKLLENAEKLIDMKIHPTVITKGYHIAAEKAKIFLNDISIHVTLNDEELLKNIVKTAMTGKGAESSKDNLKLSVNLKRCKIFERK
jgi:hypothetical protein